MAGYIGPTPVPQATQNREAFTAVSTQTTFNTSGYTPGFLDVYLNGVKLAAADFTATNGSDVVLASGAAAGDILEVVSFTAFEILNQSFSGTTTVVNLTATGTTTLAGASTSANITFGDNDKAIFGAGSDLQIYHDGANSYIDDAGTGGLIVRADNFYVRKANDVENMIIGSADGAVTLYHDNSTKLATTSTGVDITGTLTSDGLTVNNSSVGDLITVTGANGTDLRIGNHASANGGIYINSQAASDDLRFRTQGSDRMTITSSGNVGIGTSSPRNASGFVGLTLDDASGSFIDFNDSGVRVLTISGNATGNDINTVTAIPLRFKTNNTERMRLDASGNLLVANTTGASADTGHIFAPTGIAFHVRDGGIPLVVDRLTNDGDLQLFRKDGTTVGKIRSRAGIVSTIILDPRSGQGAGITGAGAGGDTTRFMTPTDENGNEINGKVSLGNSANAFRDLYLSGGVFLGGTGSVNKLDDYEEGTYVVTLTPNSGTITINPSYNKLAYTKIGRQVTITGRFRVSSVSSPSGDVSVNLPFTSHNGSLESDFAALQVTYYSVDFPSTTIKNFAEVNPNGTTASLLIERDNLPWTNVGGGAFNGSEIIYLNGTYLTDS
tara:strand:+ start:1462 stop:3294 length:1833 start_codon:yes stop_codon:yes gene_type:complete